MDAEFGGVRVLEPRRMCNAELYCAHGKYQGSCDGYKQQHLFDCAFCYKRHRVVHGCTKADPGPIKYSFVHRTAQCSSDCS